jgi:hypothetical protein
MPYFGGFMLKIIIATVVLLLSQVTHAEYDFKSTAIVCRSEASANGYVSGMASSNQRILDDAMRSCGVISNNTTYEVIGSRSKVSQIALYVNGILDEDTLVWVPNGEVNRLADTDPFYLAITTAKK